MSLYRSCMYSFQDLLNAAGKSEYKDALMLLSQELRNNEVKKLCKIAGWYYKDVVGSDGVIYTAFSPKLT